VPPSVTAPSQGEFAVSALADEQNICSALQASKKADVGRIFIKAGTSGQGGSLAVPFHKHCSGWRMKNFPWRGRAGECRVRFR
jgi:hypothetical protein